MKREKLNPVGSPEKPEVGKAEAVAAEAGNKRDRATDERSNSSPGSQTASSSTSRQGTNQADRKVLEAESNRGEYAEATQKGSKAKSHDLGWRSV